MMDKCSFCKLLKSFQVISLCCLFFVGCDSYTSESKYENKDEMEIITIGRSEGTYDQDVYYEDNYDAGWTVEKVPNPKLQSNNWVSNPDGILSTSVQQQINEIIQSLEDSLTIEVAVVALNSIGYDEPRDFAHRLFNEWKIGKKKDDNGLLILLTLDNRDITFETGYGLEGVLPDAICKRIQMSAMVPYFSNDDWDEGMISGVKAVAKTIYTGDYSPSPAALWLERILAVVPAGLWVFLSTLFLFFNYKVWKSVYDKLRLKTLTSTTARYFLNTSDSLNVHLIKNGVFLFPVWPALLAILIWLKLWYLPSLRKLGAICPKCNAEKLVLLTGKMEQKSMMTDSDRVEAQLGSVSFRFYRCNSCNEVIKDQIPKRTSHRPCPSCHCLTLVPISKNIVVKKATTVSTGLCMVKYKCAFCGELYAINEVIPRAIESFNSSSSSSSDSWSSGGSSSSGSSSSGSSSSGSSFFSAAVVVIRLPSSLAKPLLVLFLIYGPSFFFLTSVQGIYDMYALWLYMVIVVLVVLVAGWW